MRSEEVCADRQADEGTEHGSSDERTAEVIADHVAAECGIDDDGIENTDHRRGEYAYGNVGSVLQVIVLFFLVLSSVMWLQEPDRDFKTTNLTREKNYKK